MPGFTADTDGIEHSDSMDLPGLAKDCVYPAAGGPEASTAAAVTIWVAAGALACGGGLAVVGVGACGTGGAEIVTVVLGIDDVAPVDSVWRVSHGRQRSAAATATTAVTTPAAITILDRGEVGRGVGTVAAPDGVARDRAPTATGASTVATTAEELGARSGSLAETHREFRSAAEAFVRVLGQRGTQHGVEWGQFRFGRSN